MDDFEKTVKVNWLIDLYGDLLTNKQQDYLKMYYEEDLSLSEIADELNISRNAVYDQVKRALKALEGYEEKLGLMKKHEERLSLINEIEKDEKMDHDTLSTYLERLKDI